MDVVATVAATRPGDADRQRARDLPAGLQGDGDRRSAPRGCAGTRGPPRRGRTRAGRSRTSARRSAAPGGVIRRPRPSARGSDGLGARQSPARPRPPPGPTRTAARSTRSPPRSRRSCRSRRAPGRRSSQIASKVLSRVARLGDRRRCRRGSGSAACVRRARTTEREQQRCHCHQGDPQCDDRIVVQAISSSQLPCTENRRSAFSDTHPLPASLRRCPRPRCRAGSPRRQPSLPPLNPRRRRGAPLPGRPRSRR